MIIGIILGIIFFALAAVGFGVGGYFVYRETDEREAKYKIGGCAGFILGILFLISFILVPFSFHTVDTGEVAVVKHMGEAKEIRSAGTYYDFWITKKYDKYDAKVQNLEIVTMSYSKDAQTMDVAMTVQFQINSVKAIEIAKQYGSMETLTNRIQSVAIEKTKSTLSSYSAMDIIENRSSISPIVEETIKKSVDEDFFVNITAVVLTNIDFSDAFETIVEDKMIAEQEKLKAQYEKETAIVNAEKELEVAKLVAEAKIEAAKADAQSQIEIAKAEAQAIQLKSVEIARALGFTILENTVFDEIGNEYVEYTIDFTGKSPEEIAVITDYLKYIEYLAKWDGDLPDVLADSSANILIPTP